MNGTSGIVVIACILVGAALASALLVYAVLRPLASRSTALQVQVAELQSRVEAMRAAEADLSRRYDEVKDLPVQLAQAHAKLAATELHEKDVDARLQQIAGTYVEKARETLLAAVAERFKGDSNVFREQLHGTITPLDTKLADLDKALKGISTAQVADQAKLKTLLDNFHLKIQGLDDATQRVERVLGNSQARGSWGEFELQRLLELTGMTEHISFNLQESGYGPEGAGRPDVVLKIPGNLTVPIDSKVPFSAYQNAMTSTVATDRDALLKDAVTAIRSHIKVLETRKYHVTPGCIGWTIMFIPIEAMLSTLFSYDRKLFDIAREARVLIASPLTLMLYLEAFSRGWAAQSQSENAQMILTEAKTLVSRLGVFSKSFGDVGRHLNRSVDSFNAAVASYEARVGPQARKIIELRGDEKAADSAAQIDTHARMLDVSRLPRGEEILELTDSAQINLLDT